jgi:glutamine synthetase type III
MLELRATGDELERHVERELWPMPTYQELLTLR